MKVISETRSRCGRCRMVVGFTTTYAISAYHHWYCEFKSRSGRGAQHYVIHFSVTCDRSLVFSGFTGFLHQWNRPSRYNWNFVERDVKLNQANKMSETDHEHYSWYLHFIGFFSNLKIMFSCLHYLFSTKWYSNLWVIWLAL